MLSRCRRWSPVIAGVLCVAASVSFVAAAPTCPPTLAPPTQDDVHAAVRDARDHGALWTIEKDGRGSWLYGTIHVGNLAMSWDHRAFDGAYAPGFLVKMKQSLETRDWVAEL